MRFVNHKISPVELLEVTLLTADNFEARDHDVEFPLQGTPSPTAHPFGIEPLIHRLNMLTQLLFAFLLGSADEDNTVVCKCKAEMLRPHITLSIKCPYREAISGTLSSSSTLLT